MNSQSKGSASRIYRERLPVNGFLFMMNLAAFPDDNAGNEGSTRSRVIAFQSGGKRPTLSEIQQRITEYFGWERRLQSAFGIAGFSRHLLPGFSRAERKMTSKSLN